MNNIATQELPEIEELISRLRSGEWDRTQFRGRSVHYGIYTQRQGDRYFLRVRLPQGIISVTQLLGLAAAIEGHARGACHFTTRQGVEVHDVALDAMLPLCRALAEFGLSSHETGGSAVRGIMVCPHAGVGEGECFDVTPYAALLTQCFVRHPDFQALPRKLKIGFSCCADDCAHTLLQDLGFQARVSATGERGFRVLAGGGTGAMPKLAQELYPFIPHTDAPIVTEAFLRMFNRLGDREHRQRSRVKFLLQKLGLAGLREEVNRELESLRIAAKQYPSLPVFHEEPPHFANGIDPDWNEEVRRWSRTATERQQQDGFTTVRVSLPGGAITSAQLRALAQMVQRFASGVRATPDQGFLLRFVRVANVPAVHSALAAAGLLQPLAATRLVACPGSSGCSNAFTHAPGLAAALTARVAALGHETTVGKLRIRVSGCPNGCGMHASADFGLEGIASRLGNDWFPAYRVWVGARESEANGRTGFDMGSIPARRAPDCVAELVAHYVAERAESESLPDFVDRTGTQAFAAIVQKHGPVDAATDHESLMTDWAETSRYLPRNAKAAGVC